MGGLRRLGALGRGVRGVGSVRFPDVYPQVLFTSDLKSFADYGTGKRTPVNGTGLLTPEDTPEPTPTRKRKRGVKVEVKVETTSGSSLEVISATPVVEETRDDGSSALTLAERVKRRRRTKT